MTRQSPEVYRALSMDQREAFVEMAKELREKGW
jgi:hypothetical protein